MGLEQVKDEIIDSAKRDYEVAIEATKKEAVNIKKEAKEKVAAYAKKLEKDKENELENIEKMKLSQGRAERKRIILAKKRELVEELFEKVTQAVAKIDEAKRRNSIEKLVKKAEAEMEISTIYCNKKDRKFIKNYNSEEIDIIGGIITENKDKTIRLDLSYDTSLKNIKDDSLQDIAKILFSNG